MEKSGAVLCNLEILLNLVKKFDHKSKLIAKLFFNLGVLKMQMDCEKPPLCLTMHF